jgi:hypothetical protein
MKVGDKVIVIERTSQETFEWIGEVININDSYIETVHQRNAVTHPEWLSYLRAYEKTWIKHYSRENLKIQ